MADPVDPTTPVSTDTSAFDTTAIAAGKVTDAFSSLGKMAEGAKGAFGLFQGQMDRLKISFQQNESLTQDQAAAFGVLSTSLLGARKAFEGLSGVDTSGLDTISKQWSDLNNIIQNSPINQAAKDFAVTSALDKFGANSKEATAAAKQGSAALGHFAKAFFESADNGLRMQNAMVQLAAKTGNLKNVVEASGPGLSKINFLLQAQQKALTESAKATGLSAEQVESFYGQLGQVPRALESTVEGSNTAGKSVSMLTATIQFAKGAGRSLQDVAEDLKVAFREYGMTGEEALKFTARMTELSNKFGIELSDVQGALRETAGMFKMFGNEAEGAAKMMNSYLGELQKTGISGKAALEVMNGMTQGIKGMGLAQKAFLSAQTGGGGGLMGAFQIEKMMRDGKIDEVFDKVRQTMSKQFGRIVTLDEAQSSPQAAAQMTKQMMLLQQGPLGKFAKDDQSAMRILEAFKKRDEGGPSGDLSKSIVQDTMKTGIDLQEKSVTELTKIRELIQGTQGAANFANLTTMQHSMTAGVGAPVEGADFNADMRDNLRRSGHEAGIQSGRTVEQTNSDVAKRMLKDRSGVIAVNIAQDYKKFFDELGPALKGPINKIRDMFTSGKTNDAHEAYKGFLADIQKKREELASAPEAVRNAGMQQADKDEANIRAAYGMLSSTDGAAGISRMPKTPDMGMDLSNMGVSGGNVNRAAARSANTGANAAGTHTHTPTAGANAGQQVNGQIRVQVEGYCIDCQQKIKGSEQSHAVNTGPRAEK